MAIDTAKKLHSAASFLFFLAVPLPEKKVRQADEAQICWIYRDVKIKAVSYFAEVHSSNGFFAEIL